MRRRLVSGEVPAASRRLGWGMLNGRKRVIDPRCMNTCIDTGIAPELNLLVADAG